jgi:predicted GNAT family acetyltransferase
MHGAQPQDNRRGVDMDHAAVLTAIGTFDRRDAEGFSRLFAPGGELQVGNRRPAVGRGAIARTLDALFRLLDQVRHTPVALWPTDEGWVLEAEVAVRVKGVRDPVQMSGTVVVRAEGDVLRDVRYCFDLSPLYAAAFSVREDPRRAGDAEPDVALERGVGGGAWSIAIDGERAAELAFSALDYDLLLVERTHCGQRHRGQGLERRLVDAAVDHARTSGLRLVPICPVARAIFDAHPELRDVLA